jgi:hypothetical protein
VHSCSANTVVNPPLPLSGADDAWTYETNDPTHFEQTDHCAPSDDTGIDGLVSQTKLNSGSAPLGRFAQWRFDAPAGTSLTRLRMWRYAGKQTNLWELFARTADGTKLPGNDCTKPPDQFACTLGGPGVMDDFDSLNTTSLQVGLACSFAMTSCSTGATLHDAWSAMYSAIVTVNDPVAPIASGGSGSLFAGGYLRGRVTAGVASASDSTGIRALHVRVDGSAVARSPDRACDFTRRAPCPQLTTPESLSFDSRGISDGTHTAQVGVLDSGENFTPARTEQITLDNTPPVAPTPTSPPSVTTAATAAAIAWTEPRGQVAPITSASVDVCGPTGCQTSAQAAGDGSGTATISLPSVGTYTVRVALRDAAGNVNPNQAAAWTITRAVPVALPPIEPTSTPSTPTPAKTTPRLLVARPTVARDRRTVTVRGRVAAGVSGKVMVKASARIGGRTRTVTRRASIRGRRYAVRLRLPSTRWRTAQVTVRYGGSATRNAATVTRTVRQRAQIQRP